MYGSFENPLESMGHEWFQKVISLEPLLIPFVGSEGLGLLWLLLAPVSS